MAPHAQGSSLPAEGFMGRLWPGAPQPLLGTVPWFGTVLVGPCALPFSPHSGAITIFQGYLFFIIFFLNF